MKKIVLLLSVITVVALSFSSCKKCYDCNRDVTSTVDGVEVMSADSVSVCGSKDRDAYEAVGYKCDSDSE